MDNNQVQLKDPRLELKKEEFLPKRGGFGEKLASLIVKYSGGLIKNEKQANYTLMAISLVIFLISLIIFFRAL